MTLKDAFRESRQPLHKIGKDVGMSSAALSRLSNYGEYPSRLDPKEVRRKLTDYLTKYGVTEAVAFPLPGLRPNYGNGERREAASGAPLLRHNEGLALTEEDIALMQLDHEVLTHFGLKRNPFVNDIDGDDDVFETPDHKRVDRAIRKSIEDRGLLALMGPSGAGKTTLLDGIEAEYGTRADVVICKTFVMEREKLSPSHLTRALIYGLEGAHSKIPLNAEDAGRKLAFTLLSEASSQRRKVILWIDDAHFSNRSVLRQLKTFYEQKVGYKRLLSIVLVGLPELAQKLAMFPEIGNRTSVQEMPSVPVDQYLEFKLSRAGSAANRVFDPSGLVAFVNRFRRAEKGVVKGFPLDINAACIRAMTSAVRSGAAPGEKISARVIDNLPGATARKPRSTTN